MLFKSCGFPQRGFAPIYQRPEIAQLELNKFPGFIEIGYQPVRDLIAVGDLAGCDGVFQSNSKSIRIRIVMVVHVFSSYNDDIVLPHKRLLWMVDFVLHP